MPDMSRETLGQKSQKMGEVNTPPTDEEVKAKKPPQVKRAINEDMPDIASEVEVGTLKPGTRFLARFINDPNGDTGRQNRENWADLMSGKIVRNGLGRDYWANHYKDRPPIAISGEKGKFKLTE